MNFSMTIDQAIKYFYDMANRLEEFKEKYPNAKFSGKKLILDGKYIEDAKRDGDSVGYWSIYGEQIWIDTTFRTKDEDE